MGNLFIQRLQHLTQDTYLDRSEYQALKTYQQELETQKNPAAYVGDQVLNSLARYEERTHIQFRLPAPVNTVSFDFTPAYSEQDALPGNTMEDRLAHVSQKDNLLTTDDEGSRCASAAVLSAFLISGGSFADALKKLDLPMAPVLNYENIHVAQEKLYDLSNQDNRPGLSLSTGFRFQNRSGKITEVTPEGEVLTAAKTLGLKVEGILGETRDTRYARRTQIESFFANHPRGNLLVSVHLNTDTGEVVPPSDAQPVNHAVLVYKRQGVYYLLDSGGSHNGVGNSRKALSLSEMSALAFTSTGSIFGLSR